jgi:tRNA-dihydrouridine synthase
MTRCAELLEKEDFSFDFVDVNAGCPIDCITGRGAGSALMTRPKRLENIVRGMASQLSVAVTVKIRAGWSESKMNAPALCAASAGRVSGQARRSAGSRPSGYLGEPTQLGEPRTHTREHARGPFRLLLWPVCG